MNLIKRHKGLAIVGGLTLILLIVMFAIFARMIFSTGETEYGNRLKNLAKLSKSVTNGIIAETQNLDEVEDLIIRVQVNIIYTTTVFKQGTKLDKAKGVANDTLAKYTEDIMADYDFGYFLKENVESTEDKEEVSGFLVAGTKHPDTKTISWTKR